MFKVRSAEEAMIMAKELCGRHAGLVKGLGVAGSAREVALKILLHELQQGEPVAKAVLARPVVGTSAVAAAPSSSSADQPGGSNKGDAAKPKIVHETIIVDFSAMRQCAYCTEPTSRFCKETGRRHGTKEERALVTWKKMYRQLQIASQFVNSARLGRGNTCTEGDSIEIDLDRL